MVLGMAVVFMFLTILLLVLLAVSFLFRRFLQTGVEETEAEQEIAAAIAAIGAFEKL
jgi:sodium pump decarboxylase gamma subunit